MAFKSFRKRETNVSIGPESAAKSYENLPHNNGRFVTEFALKLRGEKVKKNKKAFLKKFISNI